MAKNEVEDKTETGTTDDVELEASLADVFNDDEVIVEGSKGRTSPDDSLTISGSEESLTIISKEKSKKGEVEAKAEPKVETPSTESIGLQAALVAERQKRQAVEEKLKSLEEPEKIPDPIEDPEGYAEYIKTASTKGLAQTKIDLSRSMMLSVKEDYPEKEKIFMDLIGSFDDGKFVVTNELLHKQFLDSDNPGLFAYDYAVDHLLAEKYKDPDFEKNLEARLTEKILASLEAPKESRSDGLSAVDVPDLTKATASGSNTEPVEKEVTEIGQLFPEDDNL